MRWEIIKKVVRLWARLEQIRTIQLRTWYESLKADRSDQPLRLTPHGHKTFSQSDEDGLTVEIFRRIGVTDLRFIEFGVADGRECNTALLLMTGWRGLWIDGSDSNLQAIWHRHADLIASGHLTAKKQFITAENIDVLLGSWAGGTPEQPAEIDLLSIDIDRNDYWIWSAVRSVNPRVVIVEYNAAYPPPLQFVCQYDALAVWDGSNYCGASLQSLCELGAKRGYSLVGCSISGANAFFVRNDELIDAAGLERFFSPNDAIAHFEPLRTEFAWFNMGHRPGFGPNALPGRWLSRADVRASSRGG